MYSVTIKGKFELVSDREDLLKLLSYEDGMEEVADLLRKMNRQEQKEQENQKCKGCDKVRELEGTIDDYSSALSDIKEELEKLDELTDSTRWDKKKIEKSLLELHKIVGMYV